MKIFKEQMLSWANQFSICSFLDNNQYNSKYHSFDFLLAAGARNIFSPVVNKLEQLDAFTKNQTDWLFGHIGYDLKNEIEHLSSSHPDYICFPDLYFFQPEIVIWSDHHAVTIAVIDQNPAHIFSEIVSTDITTIESPVPHCNIRSCVSKEKYLQVIEQLRQHILRGDCYEINYCMEFFDDTAVINPLYVYHQLTKISPNPFSCFYKLNNKYLLCASPERYIKKAGGTIISQPIKGTIKRSLASKEEDLQHKVQLQLSQKERSENVMVVDLVRNDLSKVCKDGSVMVDELFGIYTFPQLHQMISTIKGDLKEGISFAGIIQSTFPMGSMTGAPKKRVMELIEQYEQTKRGIFSGAVGYINPAGDFDFNVVIRSIMYNATNKYLSYLVGSGITFYSNAADEYDECMLKAKAIENVLL